MSRIMLMKVSIGVLFASAWMSACAATTISISGTVKDADGKAIGGVDVYAAADPKVKTASAADGLFALSGTIPDPSTRPAATQAGAAAQNTSVVRTPIAAAKAGYLTAQVLSPALDAKGLGFTLYPAIVGTKVTLMGNRMNYAHLREEAQWDNKKGKEGVQFLFLLAFDSPAPGIKALVDQIWADYHPGPTLDANAAKELEDQFKSRLLYYIDGPLAEAMMKKDNYGPGSPMSVTGVVQERDGKKWITVSETGSYNGPKYPERITGPVKPLVELPVKAGLTIKLTEALSDTLIYVPPGRYYMGNALEQIHHWQERRRTW